MVIDSRSPEGSPFGLRPSRTASRRLDSQTEFGNEEITFSAKLKLEAMRKLRAAQEGLSQERAKAPPTQLALSEARRKPLRMLPDW
jgi:hypothetical protein